MSFSTHTVEREKAGTVLSSTYTVDREKAGIVSFSTHTVERKGWDCVV